MIQLVLYTSTSSYVNRVLLATIRDKGFCPCPRCRIPKSNIRNLGTCADMRQRQTLAREDDNHRKRRVNTAREIIYDKGFAITNDNVEKLLKPDLLVPTLVR